MKWIGILLLLLGLLLIVQGVVTDTPPNGALGFILLGLSIGFFLHRMIAIRKD